MKKVEKYSLGIDIGISSVGWGMLELDDENNPVKIIDRGVKIFSPGENVKTGESKAGERRAYRGTRRLIRRRELRLDRTRYLLYNYGLLDNYVDKEKYNSLKFESEKAEYLTEVFKSLIEDYYSKNNTNPYELKVKALSEKLSKDELAIIMVHYAKHRGYKSNRQENGEDAKENSKVLNAISINKKELAEQKYRTVSEMFVKSERFKDRIRNTTSDYKMVVTREMLQDEINKVLDKQIEYGLIDGEFKKKFLGDSASKIDKSIFSGQRNYAKGPGGDSKYGGNLIEKMTGICRFDHKPRAPKHAPSTELFVNLSKLINLRYYANDDYGTKYTLSKDEILKCIELLKTKNELKYNDIIKIVGKNQVAFENLSLSKSKYTSVLKKFKEEQGLDEKQRIDFNILSKEKKDNFAEMIDKELFKSTFGELKFYSSIRSLFIKKDPKKWEKIKDNFDLLDIVATILTNYKTNEDIKDELEKANIIEKEYYDLILELPNINDHNNLSLDLIKKLNKIMLDECITYDKAMKKLGYNHSDLNVNFNKYDTLIPIYTNKSITNQRVIRSLAQTRKVINAVIKQYGMPYQINIETARELSKSMQERNEIKKNQEENKEKNQQIKEKIVELSDKFLTTESVKPLDVLKYKLWEEQGEVSPYSQKKIKIEDLFNDNMVQVDHILPYSRTYNDSYLNKTLVLTEDNQNKGNKTPYEYFGGNKEKWNKYANYVDSLNINDKKKSNYLLKNLTPDIEQEMRNQNLNDTKIISKTLVDFIKAHLNVKKVHSYPGAVTGKLRSRWRLNGLTSSYESTDYIKPSYNDDKVVKNRDNHLHHALDALVIASINDSLARKVAQFELYSKLIIHNNKNVIENLKNDTTMISNYDGTIVDDNTGEVLDMMTFGKYFDKLEKKGLIKYDANNIAHINYPEPYPNFCEEAKTIVYEHDSKKLKEKFEEFKSENYHYTDNDIENLTPLIPVQTKTKLSGKLHGETLYGYHNDKTGNGTMTNRISVISEGFNSKKLEQIIQKNGGSKEVYESLKEWLGDSENENGKKAYDKKGYPRNKKTNNIIKKITIETPYNGKGHFVRGSIVERENLYLTKIYKSKDKNDEKLYFVGFDLYDIEQMKNYNKIHNDFKVTLWYGQGKYIILNYSNLIDEFDLYLNVPKTSLVKITKTDGTSGLGYFVGSSNGFFEILSPIGDDYDLLEEGLIGKLKSQNQITVSTIKNVEIVNIDTLGKIHGLQTSNN